MRARSAYVGVSCVLACVTSVSIDLRASVRACFGGMCVSMNSSTATATQ